MQEINYHKIMERFDPENDVPLTEFCSALVKESDYGESEIVEQFLRSDSGESLPSEVYNAVDNLSASYLGIGFAVGYAIAKLFQNHDQDIQETVKDLQQRLLEEKVLPYPLRISQNKVKPQTVLADRN